jgi:MtN3 and saliva related transmembrane protein
VNVQVLGWIALGLVQTFYLPQTIKIIRTKEVAGLSLSSWVILWLGLLFYLVYSIYVGNMVFTVGNAAGVFQSTLVIGLVLRYRPRGQAMSTGKH